MPRVFFTSKYTYTPSADRRVSINFHPSEKPQLVKLECAQAAVSAGCAKWADPEMAANAGPLAPGPESRARGRGAVVRGAEPPLASPLADVVDDGPPPLDGEESPPRHRRRRSTPEASA